MTARASTLKLYYLENNELPMGHQFATFDALVDFVAQVTNSAIWRGLKVTSRILVKSNGDRDFSEAETKGVIWIANGHWYPSIVLHELAHIAVKDGRHTRAFLKSYVTLLAAFMGCDPANLYLDAFKRNKLL